MQLPEDALEKLTYIFDECRDYITLIKHDYTYELVNDSYCRAMEKKRDDILGRTVAQVWGENRFHNNIKHHLDRCLTGEEIEYLDTFMFGPFERHMQVTIKPYYGGPNKEVSHVLVFTRDVTRLTEIESRLNHYEFRDATTGLINRRSFDIIIEKEIEEASRAGRASLRGVLFISLHGFNKVNQTYGHHIGDLLLENTALRIKQCLVPTDYLFRFDGTNLAVVLTDIARPSDAAEITETIQEAISVPYHHPDMDLTVSSNIGVSIYPDDGGSGNELIQHATSACTEAESQGYPFLMYNRSLHDKAIARIELVSDLGRAFDSSQFEVHYHPIVNVSGHIVGAEALIRWNHPTRGMLLPGHFIGLAEENGLVGLIDRWVLYNVTRQLAAWRNRNLFVSVNLSADEFASPHLAEIVSGALRGAGNLDPRRLKLEITESQCMRDPDAAVEQMKRLAKLSVDLWVDDFGTGYSSLSYLKRLPAPIMKLDRIFVHELVENPEDVVYVANILNSVRSRGKEVVVEGVESEDQHRILQRIGCNAIQGYFFSRPLPAARFTQLLDSGRPLPI